MVQKILRILLCVAAVDPTFRPLHLGHFTESTRFLPR